MNPAATGHTTHSTRPATVARRAFKRCAQLPAGYSAASHVPGSGRPTRSIRVTPQVTASQRVSPPQAP
ncbi:hypothetical protein PV416_40600, partial [Streptomyces ipomoeae]|uniref:hypothetical protein n=1 Tax=Streptomyces ipomoeae TaxID=103232 RepID=UPI0029A72D09